MRTPSIPLRHLLPGAVTLLLLALLAAVLWFQIQAARTQTLTSLMAEVWASGAELQRDLERGMRRGSFDQVVGSVVWADLHPLSGGAVLVDSQGLVRAGTRAKWVGQPAASVLPAHLVEAAQRTGPSVVLSDVPPVISGTFPISFDTRERPGDGGLLIYCLDAARPIAAARARAWETFLGLGGVILVCAVLLAVALNHLITRRVTGLAAAVGRIGAGDLSSPSRVGGGDELGALGRGLDAMMQRLATLTAEREQAFSRLRLFESAVRNASDSILITDAEIDAPGPRILFTNPAFTQMTGYSPEDVLSKTPGILQGPDLPADLPPEVRECLATATPYFGRTTHYRKDGTTFPAEWTISPIRDETGTVRHFVGVQRDITQTLAYEQTLLRYRELVETTHDLIQSFRADGTFTFVNRAWCECLGYSVDRAQSLSFWEVLDPACLAATRDTLAGVLHGEAVRNVRLTVRSAAGKAIELQGTLRLHDDAEHFETVFGFFEDITERKRDEEELRVREAKYRAVVESTPDGLWVVDMEGKILEVNEAFVQRSGWTRGELLRMRVADFEVREAQSDVVEHTDRIQRLGYDRFESALRARDGTAWPVEVTAVYWPTTGQIVAFLRDLTAQKQAQRSLQESEARLRLALESANQGIYDLNVQTGEALVTPQYATMLGYDPATFQETNASWLERVHPDDREAVAANYRDYTAGRIPSYRVEFRSRTRDGAWRWILSFGKIVERDAAGNPVRMLGTHTDITPLKETEGRLRLVVESVPVGLVATDLEGRILLANQQVERWFGYTRQELLGQHVEILIPERLRPQHRQHRFEFATSRAPHLLAGRDLLGQRKDGSEFPVEVSIGTTTSASEPVFLAAIIDITERKQAESALRNSEARYRKVIDRALDPLFIADVAGRLVDVNQTAWESLGYSREELLALRVEDIDIEFDRDRVQLQFGGLAAQPEEVAIRFSRHQRKDGTTYPVEVRASSLLLDDQVRIVGVVRDITERVEAENELLESRRYLRCVLDSLSTHIAVLDEKGHCIITNESWSQFREGNGSERPEGWNFLTSCDHATAADAEDARRVAEGVKAVIARQEDDFYHEYPCHGPTEQRWFGLRVTPFLGEGRRHVVVAREDITHRKDAEQALAQMNQDLEARVQERTHDLARLVAIMDASPDFIAISGDPEKGTMYCNAAMRRLAEARGIPPLEMTVHRFHTETSMRRVLEEGFPEAVRTGSWMGETEVIGPDGAPIPVLQLILAHRGPDGKVEYLSTVIRNIQERKRMEDELRASEERFSLIANTIQDAFWMSTVGATRILYMSPGYEKIWGRSCQSLYDDPHSFAESVHPEDRARVLSGVVGHQGGDYDAEYRILNARGEVRWVRVRGYPALGPDGKTPVVVGSGSDITERRVAEMALRERTDQLVLANVELAKASRLKDEFLASMSHELRTPLNGVLALSEALQEDVYGPLNERQVSALRDIEQSGRHLLALINDILDLSKVEAGQITLEPTPMDVGMLCQAAHRLVKEVAHKKRQRVTLTIDSSVDTILADERRLKQVLVNLLSNAVKFTPEGGSVGLEVRGDEENQTIRFVVWDTGIGIRPEDMHLLFRPFQQIDSRLSREYSGTGLGLALVRNMAELHGGGVTVESEPGKGSRFTVTIPWHEPGPDTTLEAMGHRPLRVRRVLMVEDSASDAAQLRRYLEDMNIETIVHTGASGAVSRIQAERPDLVLLDILLPDGDGWQILSAIKSAPELKQTPVIVVSVVDERPRALALGANGHLVKPVDRERMRSAITGLIIPMEGKKAIIVATPQTPTATSELVLLAEDNAVNAFAVRDALQAAGYRVEWVINGQQAVEKAHELAPKLILMDIQMPGMDGLEATRRIRAEEHLSEIPIVAVTALAMPGDRERCLAAGANDYLSKPISLRQLRQVVERLLGKGGAANQGSTPGQGLESQKP